MAAKYLWLFFVALVGSSPLDPPTETIHPQLRDTPEYRLPENAIETVYYRIQLSLEEDVFNSFAFSGTAYIQFNNLHPTNEIKLHANQLDISEAYLVNKEGNLFDLENEFISDNVTDILTLRSNSLLAPGEYMLNFTYTARLRTEDDMHGFYRSSYVDPQGRIRYLGTTQFQPTHARRAFPCFDEPSFKAQFDISIRHPSEFNAVGNTVATRYASGNFATTTFQTTPRMPTYLIAFVISDFNCTENNIYDDIPHYICSTPASHDIRDLALDFGPRLTKTMESYTGVPYSTATINKIHQFAIPDFSAGAMENWGLITYRERLILWDPEHSTNRNKQNVVTVIAHELAHFWFGNLVTCNWWSNTFLNEGFATYFEYHATQEADSTLETEKQFAIEVVQAVLASDASPNSAPLSSPASSPSQVSGRFSTISYSKGGSIFRMVHHFMGLDNFKQGLTKYLTQNKFKNTVPEDLWAAFDEFKPTNVPAGRTIETLMQRWVYNGGYPVLNVTTNGTKVTISQRRFLSSGQPNENDTWYVPVSYTTASDSNKFQDTTPRFWLLPDGNFNARLLTNETDWIILNNQQTGYYRVDYDNNLWQKIRTALNRPDFDGIHEINRAQLVNDYYYFTYYNYRTFSELLELYQFLRNDVSYYPWYSAFSAFSTMTSRTSNPQIQKALSGYILELSERFYNTVPFNRTDDNNHIFTLSKVLIVPWACRLGLKDCVDHALAAYQKFQQNTNIKPDKNLRSTIYCNGLRHSSNISYDWATLWTEFQNTVLSDEQVMLLSALGCAKDETVLNNYLRLGITHNSGIRPQDSSYVFSGVWGNNPEGVDVVLNFLINNYTDIVAYYGSYTSLTTIFNGVATRITRKEQADKLEAFITSTNLQEAQASATSALAVARNNLIWIQSFEEELRSFFSLSEEDEGETGAGSLTVGTTSLVVTLAVLCQQVFY